VRGQVRFAGMHRAPGILDAIIFGYYDDRMLMYVARTRNGFTPASRAQLFRRFNGFEMPPSFHRHPVGADAPPPPLR
jgi:hypothetical protein